MPIPRELLDDGEDVLVDAHPHWVFLSGPVALTSLALAGAIAIGLEFPQAPVEVVWVLAAMVGLPALWLCGRALRWLGVSVVVTTHRLVYRRGIVRRDLVQLRLLRIAEVHLSQSLLDRVLGAGRLVVEVQGEPQPLYVDDVRRPRSLQRVIIQQLDELDDAALGRGQPFGVPSAVPSSPIDVPRPPSFDLTPPHGVRVSPPDARSATAATAATADTVVMPGPKAAVGTAPTLPMAPASTIEAPASPTAVPSAPATSVDASATSTAATPSILDQLVQLDELRRRGIITDAEFDAKKSELLARL